MSISAVLDRKNLYNTPTKKLENQKISCVLLVCVYDTIVFEITNDLVYTRFQ